MMFFFERVTSRPAHRNIESQETFSLSGNYGVQNIQMENTLISKEKSFHKNGGADMLFVFLLRKNHVCIGMICFQKVFQLFTLVF